MSAFSVCLVRLVLAVRLDQLVQKHMRRHLPVSCLALAISVATMFKFLSFCNENGSVFIQPHLRLSHAKNDTLPVWRSGIAPCSVRLRLPSGGC